MTFRPSAPLVLILPLLAALPPPARPSTSRPVRPVVPRASNTESRWGGDRGRRGIDSTRRRRPPTALALPPHLADFAAASVLPSLPSLPSNALASIDVSSHPYPFASPEASFAVGTGGTTAGSSSPLLKLLPLASSLVTYLSLVSSFDRPRGTLHVPISSLEVGTSAVSGAGLGLYVTESMAEGTELGTYPGVVRRAGSYLRKFEAFPECGSYAWRFTDNEFYLDPTDSLGVVNDACFGGSPDVPLSTLIHENLIGGDGIPTLLARINEPPVGGAGCNVFSREDLEERTVTFYLSRDVVAGEELFMDYGLTYDRTGYAASSAAKAEANVE